MRLSHQIGKNKKIRQLPTLYRFIMECWISMASVVADNCAHIPARNWPNSPGCLDAPPPLCDFSFAKAFKVCSIGG